MLAMPLTLHVHIPMGYLSLLIFFLIVRPVISTQVDHTAVISVYNPERILCHPSNSKFELVKDMLELRVGDQQERVCLAVEDASFGVTVVMKVTLPPQIQQTSGELWVGCQYGDSRVEYCKPISVDLPCHGMFFFLIVHGE